MMAKLYSSIKMAVLGGLCVGSFLMSSLTWRHIDSSEQVKIIVGACILICMYALMVLELVNRNVAALLGAIASIAAHQCLIEQASMRQMILWEDLETLSLLLGMMCIVNVLSTTGLFEFLAIWTYRKAGGRFWTLIFTLSIIASILSAFVDNVSTMLLISPTLVKLSELEHVDPRYVLMIMVVFSNLGGCATPVGDPPNLIVIGDPLASKLGITFGSFVAYCAPGVILSMAGVWLYLRLVYKSKDNFRVKESKASSDHVESGAEANDRPAEVLSPIDQRAELKQELELLQLVETEIYSQPRSERLKRLQKEVGDEIHTIEQKLEKMKQQISFLKCEFDTQNERKSSRLDEAQIQNLLITYSIKDKPVLVQSSVVLVVVILLFFMQSLPNTNLSLGSTSLFGALVLIVMSSSLSGSKHQDHTPTVAQTQSRPSKGDLKVSDDKTQNEHETDLFEHVITKIEWSTLIFFFSLFIVMEIMAKLGLIAFIGQQITLLINQIPAGQWRSVAAITIILWASAVASSCVDNVPFTSMMIKVLGTLIVDQGPIISPDQVAFVKPLVFALIFGACFGGNGTIIGASANLVTAGISARHDFPISFNQFFKFAMPITIISLIIANLYLIFIFSFLGL